MNIYKNKYIFYRHWTSNTIIFDARSGPGTGGSSAFKSFLDSGSSLPRNRYGSGMTEKGFFLVSLNDVDREAQPFKAGSFTIRYFLSIIYHLFTLFTTASPEFQGANFMSKRSPGMATRAHIIKNASHPIYFAM